MKLADWLGFAVARLGDVAGWLGWRPALRTTSLKVLSSGITGDPEPWLQDTGQQLRNLDQSLSALPSTAQERTFARVTLVFPLLLLTLALFWIVSGLVGLAQIERATAVLTDVLPPAWSLGFVLLGSVADIGFGIGLLFRPTFRWCLLGSVLLATGYLLASALLTPWLWADPLGPMVKVFPALGLSLALWATAVER